MREWVRLAVGMYLACGTLSGQAALVHRYSFSGDCRDSVGGATGVLVSATGKAVFTNGVLRLGNTGAERSNAGDGDYVDLPNGMVSALGNRATFEAWVRWRGPAGNSWQRVFDFGSSDGGEDVSTGGHNAFYMFMTPRSGVNTLRCGYNRPPPPAYDERWVEGAAMATGALCHVAFVWDGDRTAARLFVNGALVQEGTNTHIRLDEMTDNNNWLGRAQFNDPMFAGEYDEFRIYDAPLSALAVGASRLVGPDAVITNNVRLVERGGLTYVPVNFSVAVAATNFNYNNPLLRRGEQVLGGVPFSIAENAAGNESWSSQNAGGDGAGTRSLTIPVDVYGVVEVHALLGCFWGELGTNRLASLLFEDTDGNTLDVPLDGGSELRDYQQSTFANTVNGNTTVQVLGNNDNRRVDKTRIVLPDAWAMRTLASVTLEDRGANGVQRTFISGLTVAVAPIVDARAGELALTNGEAVASWPCGGGLAADFAQTNAAMCPRFSTNSAGVAAIVFDGVDDMLSSGAVAVPTNVTGTSDWSVSAWVFNPEVATSEALVQWAAGTNAGTQAALGYGTDTGAGAAVHGGAAADMAYDGGVPSSGAWHHVALTYTGGTDGSERLYVDGRLNAFEGKALTLAGLGGGLPSPFVTGGVVAGTNGAVISAFSGALAAVRVHDRAQTGEQIAQTIAAEGAGFGVSAPSMVRVAGSLLVDLDARDLRLVSGTEVSRWVNRGSMADFAQTNAALRPRFMTYTDGLAAVTFDGLDDRLSSGIVPKDITGNRDYSVEAWVMNPAIADEECIVTWARGGGPNLTSAQLNYGSNAVWGAGTHWGPEGDIAFQAGVPAAGEWHHLVLTYPGGTGPEKLFVDGKLHAFETKTLATHGLDDGATINLTAGARWNNAVARWEKFFSGALAALRIHVGALTPAQVLDNYEADAARFGRAARRGTDIDPLDDAVAVWQFKDGNDRNPLPQNSALTSYGSFTFGNRVNTGEVRSKNADGYAAAEGTGTNGSHAVRTLGAVGTEEVQITGSVTLFARVRMGAFNGVDDIIRVGERPYSGLDYFGLDLVDGHARFSVTPEGVDNPAAQPEPVGHELGLVHAAALTPGRWYDLAGTFDADARTLTLTVYDARTGNAVGEPATTAVAFNALEVQFGTQLSNVLVLEAPDNYNGENVGGEVELAAVWDRALAPDELARLSEIVPETGTVLTIR